MDLAAFKRDMSAVEDGRWVADDEVPDLGDVRVKVRGMASSKARALFDRKQRGVSKKDRNRDGSMKGGAIAQVMREMVAEWCLVEVEGLTDGGKPIKADELAELIHEPALEPLVTAIMAAVEAVDGTRADVEDIAGN